MELIFKQMLITYLVQWYNNVIININIKHNHSQFKKIDI